MLVVSVSVAGLVTLAAMTQPSLAPEAKHSLLQYVTGKYLHPSNCKVDIHFLSSGRQYASNAAHSFFLIVTFNLERLAT